LIQAASRLFLSALLCGLAYAKLSIESPSNDTRLTTTNFYWTDLTTVASRASQFSTEGPRLDAVAASAALEGMLKVNSASGDQWAQMGAHWVGAGQVEKAKYCYLRAAQLAPNSIETVLSVASFYRNTGQIQRALPNWGRVLSSTAQQDANIFRFFDAFALNFDEISANGGLPRQARAISSYLENRVLVGDLGNAQKAWASMDTLSPQDASAQVYVGFLEQRGLKSEAAAAWLRQLGSKEPGYGKANFLLNGDFEKDLSPGLFGWRIAAQKGVRARRDGGAPHSGRSSLRIDFDGQKDIEYRGLSQTVALEAGTYRLEAMVRAQDISGSEGVGLKASET